MAEKKKKVTDNTEISVVEVTEELLREKLYEVRGVKVMLDYDLAKIYGYTTKRFNEQVKNNEERFEEDFRFKLTREEWNNLRSKTSTSSWGGSRYLPYAFTEQGVYMLMTVLRSDLAVKQSKDFVRTFKNKKKYIEIITELLMRKKRLRISSFFYFQPRTAEGSKSMTNEVKTTRNLKVIEQSGYRYQATPRMASPR
jgi:hypothetical protein